MAWCKASLRKQWHCAIVGDMRVSLEISWSKTLELLTGCWQAADYLYCLLLYLGSEFWAAYCTSLLVPVLFRYVCVLWLLNISGADCSLSPFHQRALTEIHISALESNPRTFWLWDNKDNNNNNKSLLLLISYMNYLLFIFYFCFVFINTTN